MDKRRTRGNPQPECKTKRKPHVPKISLVHGGRVRGKECRDKVLVSGGSGHLMLRYALGHHSQSDITDYPNFCCLS